MNNHNHTKCDHSLKFCETCDVCYCDKCKMEWKKQINNWTIGGGSGTMPLTQPFYHNGDALNNVTLCGFKH